MKQQWEAIKAAERAGRAQHGALDDVPVALPALPRAQKVQKRAARVGFDWADADAVMEKLDEELGELRAALASREAAAIEEEIGDLLFTAVNLARHHRLDAERTLRRATHKFETRFRHMENDAERAGDALGELSSEELEARWRAAKAAVRALGSG